MRKLMSTIELGCQLSYHVRSHTVFLFNVAAESNEHQQVKQEEMFTNPALPIETVSAGGEGMRVHRIVVEPGQLDLNYRGVVALQPRIDAPFSIDEADYSTMPVEALIYTYPSRYCESDLLARFAYEEFGELPRGYGRVQAICDWVNEHLDYVSGTTTATTTAADVLLQRTGVCRDYAHLAITLCRGVGIPARYVAGYAVDLDPPDFHGFMEAFLDGNWYIFDPTRLAPLGGLVRIGVGRDAADLAFASFIGDATLIAKDVHAAATQLSAATPREPGGSSAYSTA